MNIGTLFQKIIAFFTSIFAFFSGLIPAGTGRTGKPLDLSGYSLVFYDDFEGDTLDTEKWRPAAYAENCGYYDEQMIEVKDGLMVLSAGYREDGANGAGYYSGDLYAVPKFLCGYFEIRCICNDAGGFWSAFWLQSDHTYEHDVSRGGIGGAEIDIMEANQYTKTAKSARNCITSAIHCNGGDNAPDKIDSKLIGKFQGNDIYNSFNTYGLMWTEDEYIFYINGVETARSTFSKGVSEVPEYVRISLNLPKTSTLKAGQTTQFKVDYVKIWQLPESQTL